MFKRWGKFVSRIKFADKYRARGEWDAVRAEWYFALRYWIFGKESWEPIFESQEFFDERERKRIEEQYRKNKEDESE